MMHKDIEEIEFTIFDTETTGLEPRAGDRIVEIAGMRFKGGGVKLAEFQALVNPKRPISEAAFQVNRISEDMLKDAPGIETIIPQFLEFIEGSCLCSYNAGFDLGFLNNELKLIGRQDLKDTVVIDILKMARRLLPNKERYALWFIAQGFGLKSQQHRALSDVELAWEVFKRLKDILLAKGILDFTNLSSLFAIKCDFLENLNAQKTAQIQRAIDLGVKIKIKYLSSSGAEVSERQVIPRQIRQENGRRFLTGFCCLKNDERTFSIDGILQLEII